MRILVADGDMRRAITYLQSLHRLHVDEIQPDDILEIATLCPEKQIAQIIKAALDTTYDTLLNLVDQMLLVSHIYI